ncbi:9186_t:CDS:1, partial [Entrophospora sp. SA101]
PEDVSIFDEETINQVLHPDEVNNLSDSDESEIEPEPYISCIEATKLFGKAFIFGATR